MRFGLSGFGGPVLPKLIKLTDGVPFLKAIYVEQGYTNYEILCIGAAGGAGSGVNPGADGADQDGRRAFGGAGGGGGIHLVRGVLSTLPSSCDIVVGTAGADGPHSHNYLDDGPGDKADGEDGGPSSVHDEGGTSYICKAAGGIGGQAYQIYGFDSILIGGTGGHGGAGNVSNSSGGGSSNGGASSTDSEVPADPGGDGTWNGVSGQGGGGGAGGVGWWMPDPDFPVLEFPPSNGGRGAYNVADLSVSGPGGLAERAPITDIGSGNDLDIGAYVADPLMPGAGGGAKATALNNLLTTYGSKVEGRSGDGLVLIRLTKA